MDPAARRAGTSTTLTEAEAAALKVLQRLHAAARRGCHGKTGAKLVLKWAQKWIGSDGNDDV